MTINYVRYYAVSPGVASGRAHTARGVAKGDICPSITKCFLTSITSLPVLQMTINYVRYYAVSPGVASECAHNIQLVRESGHRMKILEITSIFSLDFSRDKSILNLPKSDPLEVTSQELQLTSDKRDQMTLRTYCLRGNEVLNVPGKIIEYTGSSYGSGMLVKYFLLCHQADQ